MARSPFVPSLLIGLVAGTVSGCGGISYSTFDSRAFLRGQIEDRLGERASRVEIPYELNDEVRTFAEDVGLAGGDEWKVEQILDLVFRHLDLEYSLYPTRTATDTYAARSGNCLSFVNLFVGIAREKRLNPFYVEVEDHQRWDYRGGMVISHGHIVAGLYVDGELRTYDFLPYRSKSYRKFRPIDELQATAHYYNNLGAEALLRDENQRAEELLTLAHGLAPDFRRATSNLGVAFLRLGRDAEAVDLLSAAAEEAPDDSTLLSNLARAYQAQGRLELAGQILDQVELSNHASPFFFVYRGDLALAEGKPAQALEYMADALRRESEAPEVHLGLVRAYLALGDLDKAQHHLERALKLDATHAEARRYVAMLQTLREQRGTS